MGKATPFEGELDHGGNPCCGQSFMGGTICSLPPGHDGFCGSECQVCGGDWMDMSCTCRPICGECGAYFDPDDGEPYCDNCSCQALQTWGSGAQGRDTYCALLDGHEGAHHFPVRAGGPTPREMAETYRSLGVELPCCANCNDELIWHEGNGGQWLGADPPRDWATCHGAVDGPKHTPMH